MSMISQEGRATKRRGNMFRLLCLCHTDSIRHNLDGILHHSRINLANFFKCLKLYISMEEWFHENNLKQEANSANSLVAETLDYSIPASFDGIMKATKRVKDGQCPSFTVLPSLSIT